MVAALTVVPPTNAAYWPASYDEIKVAIRGFVMLAEQYQALVVVEAEFGILPLHPLRARKAGRLLIASRRFFSIKRQPWLARLFPIGWPIWQVTTAEEAVSAFESMGEVPVHYYMIPRSDPVPRDGAPGDFESWLYRTAWAVSLIADADNLGWGLQLAGEVPSSIAKSLPTLGT